ncbi:hypothetical protein KUTeg_020492 [Tegillarca granosa]|uniref:RIIa domain-containing protein n=1 Tax=Tegillarca granosa TaxID=220873 RepID=A0ABQ9E8K0_TEGGR|nr:hypothetical protein KUTeg_020492 [Tegillarca granosa]
MAVPFSNQLPRLPKGFKSVLKEIAREVLKNKPDNIYEFGSRYLDQCLRVRNANRIKDRFEKIQIPLLDSCIFHKDRTNFDKVTREVERAKIIPKAYAHRLAMAICSCKRKKINIHVLMTEKNLQKRLTDLKERVAMETNWPDNLISEEVWFKRWQKPKIFSCDSRIDYYSLATDFKENLADRFEIKVLSKQYYKRCNLTERHFYTPQKPYSKTGHSSRERCIKNNFRKLVNLTKTNSSGDVLYDYLEMFYI